MAGQIKFFEKNIIDLSNDGVTITATDAVASNNGQDFVDYLRNRNNFSAYITTGSTDAANTTLVFEFVLEKSISDLILIKHNFKAYTLKYWNGSAYVDFSTPINVSNNATETTHHEFTPVDTERIQLIVTETMVTDADKVLHQFIVTQKLATGQLNGWPVIKSPVHNTNKRVSRMLSGKVNVVESVGGFSCNLTVSNWNDDVDLALIENIYFGRRGVLMWLSGGDEEQFSHKRVGYRLEDLYFVRCVNDYSPEWSVGIYTNGLKIDMRLAEAIE